MRKNIVIALLGMALWATSANAQGHIFSFKWTLSPDDTTANCASPNSCIQNIYRAPGVCTSNPAFVIIAAGGISATATTYSDSTITSGSWCYGVSFVIQPPSPSVPLESSKSIITVQLPPAPPGPITVTNLQ